MQELKRMRKPKPKHQRQPVIDAFASDRAAAAATCADAKAQLLAALPFASPALLHQLWPTHEGAAPEASWALLARYQPGYCLQRLQASNWQVRAARLAAAMPQLALQQHQEALELFRQLQPSERGLTAQLPPPPADASAAAGAKRGGSSSVRSKVTKRHKPLSCVLGR
jgi:hypothetical protein